MDEIKKEIEAVFERTPNFSSEAKARVLQKKTKSTFRWPYRGVAATILALLAIIVCLQWYPNKEPDTTSEPIEAFPKTDVPIVALSSNEQYHFTNESLSMNHGNNEYVGDVVIDPTIQIFERGDVVFIEPADDHYILARVVGLPGETVAIENGQILINNEPLNTNYSSPQVDGFTALKDALASHNYNEQEITEAFNIHYPTIKLQGHELFLVTDNWLNDWFRGIVQTDTDIKGVALGMKHPDDAYMPSPMSQYPSTDDAQLVAENIMAIIKNRDKAALQSVLHESATINDDIITFHDNMKFDLNSDFSKAAYTFIHYVPSEDTFEVGYRIEESNTAIYLQLKELNGSYKLYNLYFN